MKCLGSLILFLCFDLFGASEFRADYEYREEVHGWVKVHVMPATWYDARLRCQLEGATLASPTSPQLLKVMSTAAVKVPYQTLFTGIHDTFSKGDYFSIEGVPLAQIPADWALNEPNNAENREDCLILNSEKKLADEMCSAVYSYVCYKNKIRNLPAMTVCDTIDKAYKYEGRTGSCYKYHHVRHSWTRAFMACAAEGGHLAIPNSATEANVYRDIYDEYINSIGHVYHPKVLHLGFRYSLEEEQWRTIHGETLEGAGYDFWAKGEPNNFTSAEQNWEGENCGSIDMGSSSVGLNDFWCGHIHPFICEKNPNKNVVSVTEKPGPVRHARSNGSHKSSKQTKGSFMFKQDVSQLKRSNEDIMMGNVIQWHNNSRE